MNEYIHLINEYIHLIILLGGNHICLPVLRSDMRRLDIEIRESIENGNWFHEESAHAKGPAITGWYYTEITPTAAERVAKVLESETSKGEDWRQLLP